MGNRVTNAETSNSDRPGGNVMGREQAGTGLGMCREVTPGVYCMEAGKGISRANVYFVQSGSSWVLIDAGLANCGRLIRRTAESLFGANTPPASILLTHNHPDHAGSALSWRVCGIVRFMCILTNCLTWPLKIFRQLRSMPTRSTAGSYSRYCD